MTEAEEIAESIVMNCTANELAWLARVSDNLIRAFIATKMQESVKSTIVEEVATAIFRHEQV